MKPFTLDSQMTAMIGGAFYPTGYSMILFADPKAARQVGQLLVDDGVSGDDIYFIPPDVILSQISPTASDADEPLPSAGTDAATVRAYTKLAHDGHAALLVKTAEDEDAERVMKAVRTVPFAMAQRYRTLVIEDL